MFLAAFKLCSGGKEQSVLEAYLGEVVRASSGHHSFLHPNSAWVERAFLHLQSFFLSQLERINVNFSNRSVRVHC